MTGFPDFPCPVHKPTPPIAPFVQRFDAANKYCEKFKEDGKIQIEKLPEDSFLRDRIRMRGTTTCKLMHETAEVFENIENIEKIIQTGEKALEALRTSNAQSVKIDGEKRRGEEMDKKIYDCFDQKAKDRITDFPYKP